jgi:hypothetical protein
MTHDFPPRAHFHFQKCAVPRYVLAGEVLATENFDPRGKRFGSKSLPNLRDCLLSEPAFRGINGLAFPFAKTYRVVE